MLKNYLKNTKGVIMKKLENLIENIPNSGHIYEGGKSFFVYANNKTNCFKCAYCMLSGVEYLKEKNRGELSNLEIGENPRNLHKMMTNIPVAINNAFGDPVLQWEDTITKLKDLEKTEHEGPVGIITKGFISETKARKLKNFDLNLVVLQSVSNLPQEIEPINYEKRIESIKHLKQNEIPTIAYYRPIIPGYNDSFEKISKTMEDAKQSGVDCMVYSGLLGTPEVLDLLEKNTGEKISCPEGFSQWQNDHKLISKKVQDFITEEKGNLETFRKTSCGITYALNLEYDYNIHYSKPQKYGCRDCINRDKCISNGTGLNFEKIKSSLEIVDTEGKIHENTSEKECKLEDICTSSCTTCSISKGNVLKLEGKYTLGELGVVRWLSGLTVTADYVVPSNRMFLYHNNIDRTV